MTRPYMPRMACHARAGYAQENLCVPLTGVPQIPDEIARTINSGREWDITEQEMKRCDDIIKESTEEIQRRWMARKMGVKLEEFIPYTPDQVRAQAGLDDFDEDEV